MRTCYLCVIHVMYIPVCVCVFFYAYYIRSSRSTHGDFLLFCVVPFFVVLSALAPSYRDNGKVLGMFLRRKTDTYPNIGGRAVVGEGAIDALIWRLSLNDTIGTASGRTTPGSAILFFFCRCFPTTSSSNLNHWQH